MFRDIPIEAAKKRLDAAKDKDHPLGFRGAYVARNGKGYPRVMIFIGGRKYILSRAVFSVHHGRQVAPGMVIDHLDGDPKNNEIHNLREKTYKGNNWNKSRQKNNSSGVNGVSFCQSNGRWVVRFGRSYHKTYLHFFDAVCDRKSKEANSSRGFRSNDITARHGFE